MGLPVKNSGESKSCGLYLSRFVCRSKGRVLSSEGQPDGVRREDSEPPGDSVRVRVGSSFRHNYETVNQRPQTPIYRVRRL